MKNQRTSLSMNLECLDAHVERVYQMKRASLNVECQYLAILVSLAKVSIGRILGRRPWMNR